jgi:hypothetical protein
VQEAEMGKIMISGQCGKKSLCDPISTRKKLGIMVLTCHPSVGGNLKIGGSWFKPAWVKSETLSPK